MRAQQVAIIDSIGSANLCVATRAKIAMVVKARVESDLRVLRAVNASRGTETLSSSYPNFGSPVMWRVDIDQPGQHEWSVKRDRSRGLRSRGRGDDLVAFNHDVLISKERPALAVKKFRGMNNSAGFSGVVRERGPRQGKAE